MALVVAGQPSVTEIGQDDTTITKPTFANILQSAIIPNMQLPLKEISYLHGEPHIIWEEEKVNQMIIKEDLQYAVIDKFSYSWPDIQNLRRLIPKQCELKGEVNIDLLSNRHVLIRATKIRDYVHLLSKP
ncbi:hypothetical protein BC332_13141 [Capsicum chinense]|nr:hypothetical protein BC332_13141 [Capsicum chinense]